MSGLDPEQLPEMHEGDEETAYVSCDAQLESGETVSSVTAAEVTTEDLTLENATGTSSTQNINGVEVTAAKAVQVDISGQKASTGEYTIKFVITTTTGAIKTRYAVLKVPK